MVLHVLDFGVSPLKSKKFHFKRTLAILDFVDFGVSPLKSKKFHFKRTLVIASTI
jgi:hypothetical protein